MKLATYNILKGGPKLVHWSKMIDEQNVDLLLVQESYPHDSHLPWLLYPDIRGHSVWDKAQPNSWGSGIFSKTGSLTQIPIPNFNGWVVGAELTGASWQASGERLLVSCIHAPDGLGGYAGQVNLILDDIALMASGRDIIVGGDFNLSVSHWAGSDRKTKERDLAIQRRLANEFGLINCWQVANPEQQPHQTLRWSRDRTIPYHCDGLFVPNSWKTDLLSCDVLSGDEWNQLSDHNPVVAEFS
jgi:exonuclease III